MEPSVSLIIVTFNSRAFVNGLLSSLLKTEYPNFEVIILDNGSSDGTCDLLKDLCRREGFKIICNGRNLGYATANNIGLDLAKGDYIVFLNPDTQMRSDWLIKLVEAMDADTSIGAAQCKLLRLDQPDCFDSAGDLMDMFGLTFRRGGNWEEKDFGQYDQPEEIFSARGAAMAVRRDVISRTGGFDPLFFARMEDTDLCWRIRLLGYRIVFVPNSIVYHYGGASSEPYTVDEAFHNSKNHLVMMIKNAPIGWLLRYSPLAVIGGFVVSDLLIKRHVGLARARARAMMWVLANLRRIWERRLGVLSSSRTSVTSHVLSTSYKLLLTLFVEYSRYGPEVALRNYYIRCRGLQS